MISTPQRHVITLLYLIEDPVTQENLTRMAPMLGCYDTPQSLRSRMVELERLRYTHRVDREGISARHRPCWRWQLTRKGKNLARNLARGILDSDTTNGRE